MESSFRKHYSYKMQKSQKRWPLAEQLRAALLDCTLSHRELAEKAGVQYYAVRRMRLDGVRNRSQNAITLCKYFGIPELESGATLSVEDLKAAVQQAWDGTADQGQLILDLIRSVGQYKVTPMVSTGGTGDDRECS